MRLKSLQIKGFKSFANDTVMHFNDNVIGIVGPNGSGKSNIVDAIRWVLGEQKSKELRLESMGDVIFNGTKTKKEAASATVALTFENNKNILPSEYQYVTISRTLYRSGESEYRLNNVVCRLKDITSLFLDTGIGSNSYAIIALGMVDDILENKENARRRMFEQAAGVSKYKMRKRETMLKLKSTDEDLNRIEDLLFEIDGNVKVLEKQARRTQRFNEIKEKYKDLSVRFAVYSIQAFKERYKAVAENLRVFQDTYRENDIQDVKLQALLEKEKKTSLDKEMALSERQKSMNEVVSKIRAEENEKVLLNQKAGFKTQAKETLQKNIEDATSEMETLKEELGKLVRRIEEEMSMDTHLKDVLENSKMAHHSLKEKFVLVKSGFDEKQKALNLLEKEQYEFEKEIAVLKNKVDNTEIEIQRTQEELGSREKNNEEIKLTYDELVGKVNKHTHELRKLETDEDERLRQLEQGEKNIEKVKESLSQTNRNLDSKQNEYDLLKSMIDSYEGYPESIRFLSESWQKNPVILGDILEVEEEYKAVIEAYLEPFLNYFVVENIEEAYRGIQLLNKAQRGKAYFFVNNLCGKVSQNTRYPKNLISAETFVKIDNKYNDLLTHLLKDCFIFDGDTQDLAMVSGVEAQWTILSKYGHYIKSGFAISGGSVGLFEGKKIGRKKNLENISKTILNFQKQKSVFESELNLLLASVEELKQKHNKTWVNTLKEELNQLNQQFVKAQVQLDSFHKFQVESQNKIKELKTAITSSKDLISIKEGHLKKIAESRESLMMSDGLDNVEVTGLQDELTMASEKYNQDIILLIRHQNLVENLKKELDYKKTRLEELSQKLENNKFRLMAEEKEAIDIQDNFRLIEENLVRLYEEKKRYNETLNVFEQNYFQAKNAITELEENIRKIHREQQQLQNQIQNLKDEFTELKFKINGVGERLKIEFNIPVNDIINQEVDKEFDNQSLQEELEKLKIKISQYGDVNPLALEAYNEMSERFQKIQIQKQDIVSAKESLMETIAEIETTATRQFHEAFNQVRENFILVFRELFTEDDTCDLILENPSSPLESEIEIIAKPKGKKPKSISQLSGGEKTLTATALLFALYLLKPAPFCIFDEVDAPLDDANIQKFNKIIQKFSRQSQFIIVTHNKSTMVEVDTLYGVYMQAQGISEVSAVDFKKLKHESSEAIQ
ncbi:MAG: chromosome segregation protein SMC [Saprospiraceae bacterium]|nr:chromosome segregation protein SMC [Saprospiraceae bacterium]